MKLCKDCKHYLEILGYRHPGLTTVEARRCSQPELIDMVSGNPTDCRENRAGGLCGPEARYWEAQ